MSFGRANKAITNEHYQDDFAKGALDKRDCDYFRGLPPCECFQIGHSNEKTWTARMMKGPEDAWSG